MVDLAVPPDVEPEVAELDDVFLYTAQDVAEIVREGAPAEARAATGYAERAPRFLPMRGAVGA